MPVWIQGLRSSMLLDACLGHEHFPLITETLRECMQEALDGPNLRGVIGALAAGDIEVKTIETEVPSPFTHSLLLLGQYGDPGSIPTQERRSRLMHLHRELLRQILDEETLRNLLDEDAVQVVDARLQRTHPQRQARNSQSCEGVTNVFFSSCHGPTTSAVSRRMNHDDARWNRLGSNIPFGERPSSCKQNCSSDKCVRCSGRISA